MSDTKIEILNPHCVVNSILRQLLSLMLHSAWTKETSSLRCLEIFNCWTSTDYLCWHQKNIFLPLHSIHGSKSSSGEFTWIIIKLSYLRMRKKPKLFDIRHCWCNLTPPLESFMTSSRSLPFTYSSKNVQKCSQIRLLPTPPAYTPSITIINISHATVPPCTVMPTIQIKFGNLKYDSSHWLAHFTIYNE